MKLLVPIDGSDTSLRAIDTLLAKLDAAALAPVVEMFKRINALVE